MANPCSPRQSRPGGDQSDSGSAAAFVSEPPFELFASLRRAADRTLRGMLGHRQTVGRPAICIR
jgi:hypothetical protein